MTIAKGPLTRERLDAVNTGFKATFQKAFEAAAPTYTRFTEVVNSTAAVETYGWLGQIPGMKEWVGERNIKRLEAEAYMLRNKKFEDTVAVGRDAEIHSAASPKGNRGTLVRELESPFHEPWFDW